MQDENEELQNERESAERHSKHALDELKAKYKSLKATADELRQDRDEKARSLQAAQQKLAQREEESSTLEGEILRLKTQTGDTDTLAVIKRELSEQVTHIKRLESQNRDQRIELKQYQKQQKAIEVVEEEKRHLEGRVGIMNDLRRELDEAQLQTQILKDERKTWSAYLERNTSIEDDDEYNFQSPEDLAKAFFALRLEKLSLIDQLGKVNPELASKDKSINELESRISQLTCDLETSRVAAASTSNVTTAAASSNANDLKARARLERQRTLAVKEVEYLRAQLKTFDAEEAEFSPEKHDSQKTQHIKNLETLLDQHRFEIASLHSELDAYKASHDAADDPKTGNKRQRLASDQGQAQDDLAPISTPRANELTRRARALQDQLSQSQTQRAILDKELSTAKAQLQALQSTSRTRILELRSNPTSDHAAVKQTTLAHLRDENEALHAHIDALKSHTNAAQDGEGDDVADGASDQAHRATVARLRDDVAARDARLASEAKGALRLKQKWKAVAREFREAVASILGWKLEVMPNGRVRVSSLLDADNAAAAASSRKQREQGGEDGGGEIAGEDEGPNSIVFDGVAGTMKVSGGPRSRFEGEIRPLIEYWVDGRKEVPCFLAALTLELWERGQGTMKT